MSRYKSSEYARQLQHVLSLNWLRAMGAFYLRGGGPAPEGAAVWAAV
jgi:hypothetical protein